MNKEQILAAGKSLSSEDYDVIRKTARDICPKVILEIGSRYGTSSMLFADILIPGEGKLICVEPDPQPQWYENMKYFKNVKLIKSYSPWVNIADIPESIDYLFIDGDHRTRFAICDYHFFAPFVRVGGRIAFHDTHYQKDNIGFMVKRAIDIILEESSNLLFVGGSCGEYGTLVYEKVEDFK